jgi:urocanate hydratase
MILQTSCHNPILGYSPKFTFFQNKKNQKNKIKAGNAEKADQERLQK